MPLDTSNCRAIKLLRRCFRCKGGWPWGQYEEIQKQLVRWDVSRGYAADVCVCDVIGRTEPLCSVLRAWRSLLRDTAPRFFWQYLGVEDCI